MVRQEEPCRKSECQFGARTPARYTAQSVLDTFQILELLRCMLQVRMRQHCVHAHHRNSAYDSLLLLLVQAGALVRALSPGG